MAHRLNTNKQFMIGNGILAFAVLSVIVFFVYMSLRMQRQQQTTFYYPEPYQIWISDDFGGDSLSLFVNDSLLVKRRIPAGGQAVQTQRFAEQSVLLLVDHATDEVNSFNLSPEGGNYRLLKDKQRAPRLLNAPEKP